MRTFRFPLVGDFDIFLHDICHTALSMKSSKYDTKVTCDNVQSPTATPNEAPRNGLQSLESSMVDADSNIDSSNMPYPSQPHGTPPLSPPGDVPSEFTPSKSLRSLSKEGSYKGKFVSAGQEIIRTNSTLDSFGISRRESTKS